MNKDKTLIVFQDKKIRRTWFNDEWWFAIEDIITILIDSKDIKQYINKMRRRDKELNKGWVQFVHTLPIATAGGLQSIISEDNFLDIKKIKNQYNIL